MKKTSIHYFSSSFLWGVIAKLTDASIKFFSIPLLLQYFGQADYGLITLAVASNAYMHLLNMGMNTGAIKFFAQWIYDKNYSKVDRIARTSVTVYLSIGIINLSLLFLLAIFGRNVFNVTVEQFRTLRVLLIILACFSSVNWVTLVFNQLLTADEKIKYSQQVLSIRAILNFAAVYCTILFKLSIFQYFILHLSASVLVFLLSYMKCKKGGLITSLIPAFYWKEFSVIFKYSLAIFIMGFFQFSATQSRPIILGMFSASGVSILSEYRIIEVFPIFIISIGGMLQAIFLPKTSKAVQSKDQSLIEKTVYEGTKYTSIIVSALCFPIILVARELLTLYVGIEFDYLAKWLIIWVLTLTLSLHNSPVSSLVLATGKTKMLVYSSAIAFFISIAINIAFCSTLGVGSAVIGYLIYIIIQVAFHYFYYNHKVLHLNSLTIFKSYFYPTFIGFISMVSVFLLGLRHDNLYLQGFFKGILWVTLYILLLYIFKIININDIKGLLKSRKRNS